MANPVTPVAGFKIAPMEPLIALATRSRDGHLALCRVERQQRLIEILVAAAPVPRPVPALAQELGVSARTVERDLERLRDAGVPIRSQPGRAGWHTLAVARRRHELTLSTAQVATLISCLAILGPTATASAASTTAALARALEPGQAR